MPLTAMKVRVFLTFMIASTVLSCKTKAQEKTKKGPDYELVADDVGIQVEQFDSTVVNSNKYNLNNTIYKVGNSFKYSFKHYTAARETQFFKINDDRNSWSFTDADSNDSTIIKSVLLQVADGNPFEEHIPDYNQTNITYTLKEGFGYSMTGVIENEANVWIHPPREKYFRILELNPFPYVKAPYEIGTKWTWKLVIGAGWADERWKSWEGQIENQYQYEIVNKEVVKNKVGQMECFVIQSFAKSRIGETKLTAYFNPKYGFVKLDYTNIDGSKTLLELVEYVEAKNED